MRHEILDLAQGDGIRCGVDARHVDGVRARHAQSLALAHGVADGTMVAPQHLAIRVHDVALGQGRAVALLDVGGEVVLGHETDALAVALAGVLEALLARDATYVALLEEAPERQQHPCEALLRERVQDIALVLRGVERTG